MIYLITDARCIPFIYSNPLSPNQWPPLRLVPLPKTMHLTSALGRWGSGGGGGRALQAGALLMYEPSRPLFHLRACQPFMSSPFEWPWEFLIFLCLVGSLWEFLAHLFSFLCPLFISFFTALHHRDSALGPLPALLFSAMLFNSLHCLVQLLYFIYIFVGELLMVRKVVSLWKGLMFHNCLDNTFCVLGFRTYNIMFS